MSANYIPCSIEYILKNTETIQGDVADVPSYTETDVVVFTIPSGKTFVCSGGSASGMVDTEFRYYVDGEIKEMKRLAWTDRNVKFDTIKKIEASKIVKITAYHKNIVMHDFTASVFGYYVS